MYELTTLLSRIQFGFTIGFHIIFPTLNIGLATFLCIVEGLWLKTRKPVYYKMLQFWIKIFALTFGMGVVSGIVLSYEIGTNFAHFTERFGSILGPLLAYEVMTAFFLEAGFLGVMLFGFHKVSARMHYFATIMVALGTTISAFWIMSANSWMQTPAGYIFKHGGYVVHHWAEVILNPSFIPRFIHMLLASYLSSSLVIAGVSAFHLLKGQFQEFATKGLKISVIALAIVAPLQIGMGDIVGLNVYKHQPLKTAAMEGNWQTMNGAPLILFAIPDSQNEKNRLEVSIPKLASLINTHSLDGELIGLTSVPKEQRPIVGTVFYSFRIMVGIGMLLLLLGVSGIVLLVKKRAHNHRWFLIACLASSPLGFLATIFGWMVAESGRQPWVIYKLLTTADAATPLPAEHVIVSLVSFSIVYLIIFTAYLFYLFRFIKTGPLHLKEPPTTLGYMLAEQKA